MARRPLGAMLALALTTALTPALVSCAHSPAATTAAPPPVSPTAGPLTALWQAGPLAWPRVLGGVVVGVLVGTRSPVVVGLSADTGRRLWTRQLADDQPVVLDVTAADGVVVVQVGHNVGRAPAMVYPVATRVDVLDPARGTPLWSAAVTGAPQTAPVAVAGGRVDTVDSATVVVRNARTGAVLWRHPLPDGCGSSPSVAGDGAALVVAGACGSGSALVQRLDPAGGRALWTWTSPPDPVPPARLSLAGVAVDGGVAVLSGYGAGGGTRYDWPPALDSPLPGRAVVALDLASGAPRWVENGGQQESIVLDAGAVCEVVPAGFECRDDATGQPSLPVQAGGDRDGGPPYGGDGYAGIAGGWAAVAGPGEDAAVPVRVVPVRGGTGGARATVQVSGHSVPGSNYATFVVAAGTLANGHALFLLRRVDRADHPLVALRL